MRLMQVFRIIWPGLLVTTSFGYATIRAQSTDIKAERPKVSVLDITGMPVSITKVDVAYVDGRRILNYTLSNRGEEFVPTVQWLVCYMF